MTHCIYANKIDIKIKIPNYVTVVGRTRTDVPKNTISWLCVCVHVCVCVAVSHIQPL